MFTLLLAGLGFLATKTMAISIAIIPIRLLVWAIQGMIRNEKRDGGYDCFEEGIPDLINFELLGVPKMLSFIFINKNKDLQKLYSRNIQEHPENHYGTFEQFLQLLYGLRNKRGFDIVFHNKGFKHGRFECFPFTVKSDEGTEIDFSDNSLRIKITTDRIRETPYNLGEPIWWMNPDGTKSIVSVKKRNTRIFEYFVFSTLKEFYKFVRWTNEARATNSIINPKSKLDVQFNYWNLDREAKKIFNMKEKEMNRLLRLDGRAEEFEQLAYEERLKITDARKA